MGEREREIQMEGNNLRSRLCHAFFFQKSALVNSLPIQRLAEILILQKKGCGTEGRLACFLKRGIDLSSMF